MTKGFTAGFRAFGIFCILFAGPAVICKANDVPDYIVVPVGLIIFAAIYVKQLLRKG